MDDRNKLDEPEPVGTADTMTGVFFGIIIAAIILYVLFNGIPVSLR
ncbi:hypothetical protein SAMN05661091_5393 [Paenibacillus uliginis N3/975]|uniref:Uncharacterized protein n=1 Tax=Paenibacillus uliginis N3/975 TaxID=1313296 RepID=A0A1X7HR22_9BACL|nr:hypothetical protein [Paenibacillus uliginis]SMF91259.1 hypothetical protein SAMN05661091_5393 [Paenibacillus uliginis N3/975]